MQTDLLIGKLISVLIPWSYWVVRVIAPKPGLSLSGLDLRTSVKVACVRSFEDPLSKQRQNKVELPGNLNRSLLAAARTL
ncbi:hypothetical protein OUZ56_005957 [Daphnia magna]|uniref:Uncharacterized protein n=1 Tax=Daphnia magna TaxID=35525 RepID=A0ABQ9YU80_9CRUS|nr:hypothetical protein OUZ56_005957 [Daphnia magna]